MYIQYRVQSFGRDQFGDSLALSCDMITPVCKRVVVGEIVIVQNANDRIKLMLFFQMIFVV